MMVLARTKLRQSGMAATTRRGPMVVEVGLKACGDGSRLRSPKYEAATAMTSPGSSHTNLGRKSAE